MSTEIRNVEGYAVSAAPPGFSLRNVEGYAVTLQLSTIPSKATGDDSLKAMMNLVAKQRILDRHMFLSNPGSYGGPEGNTTVRLTVDPAAMFSGYVDFHYSRIPLDRLRLLNTWSKLNQEVARKPTIHELIPDINRLGEISLTPLDLVDGPITDDKVTLTAAATSKFFIPGTTVNISGLGVVVGEPWMLFDMENNKEITGNVAVTAAYTNMTIDDSLVLDNRKSAKIPANGQILLTLAQGFDPNIPEWTFEYTIRPNMTTSTYLQIMSMYASAVGAYPGINHRTSDGGFGRRWQMGQDFRSQPSCYHPNFNQNTKVGVPTSVAFVKRLGVVTIFVDGKPQMLAPGTTTNYTFAAVPWADAAAHNTIKFGATTSGLGLNVGAVRISKFARYLTEYQPRSLIPPAMDSLIPVGSLDGFDRES